MKIVYVGLRNIMGIKELEFAPDKITVIEGKNAKGKTSVLKGIQAGIGGGHDATLVTEGQTKGEVVIVFDDGMRLEKEIKQGKSKVTLKDADGKAIPRAASFLKEIIDDLGVNPIKILTASAKDRVKLLLDSIDMKTPFDKIEKIINAKLDRKDTRHPMEIIDEWRTSLYGDRTDNNRFLKEKETLVDQMRESLPFKAEERDYGAELKAIAKEDDAIQEGFEAVKKTSQEYLDNRTQELQAIKEKTLNDARDDYEKNVTVAQKEFSDEIDAEFEKVSPKISELAGKIGEITTLKEESIRTAGSIKYVKDGDKEIRELNEETEKLTKEIDGLDAIKANLLKNIPIKGMEIREGEIYLDGIAFDSVNKAARVQFALTIAGMRKAELPIVCVDNLEALDKESFAIFQEQATKTDMQFFVTRVSNSELTVNTD